MTAVGFDFRILGASNKQKAKAKDQQSKATQSKAKQSKAKFLK